MRARAREHPNDRQAGFVLLPVLLVTGLLASLALVMVFGTQNDAQDMVLARNLAWARLNADNALVRGIVAVGNPADPDHAALLSANEAVGLTINTVTIRLRLEHESGKVDLNRSDPALLRSALEAVLSSKAEDVYTRIMLARASGRFLSEIDVLLEPAQEFTLDVTEIKKRFTVLTGASGISPAVASPEVLMSLPGLLPDEMRLLGVRQNRARFEREAALRNYQAYFSPPRPIYTLRATVQDNGLPPIMRSVTFAILQLPLRRASDLAILAWR